MTDLDSDLKAYLFKKRQLKTPRLDTDTPAPEDLYRFLTGSMGPQDEQRILDYLKAHPEDTQKVLQARQLLEKEGESDSERVPGHVLRAAKRIERQPRTDVHCPHCGKPITPFQKGTVRSLAVHRLWLGLSAASFILSFVWPRYFFQWLVLSLFFGFKWAIDQKARRTQILIYKALREESQVRKRGDFGILK